MATVLVSEGVSPSLNAARDELTRGLSGLLNQPVGAGALADGAVSPITSTLQYFMDEYEEHVRLGRCPLGPETSPVEVVAS